MGSNPTLSANPKVLLRIIFRPASAWAALRARDPSWQAALLGHALPLSFLPALAWPLGQQIEFATAFLATVAMSAATVVLLATGFYVLAPLFGVRRHWNRSMTLAAYASTPVFLCGALLVVPILVIASVAGLMHSLGLCYGGAQAMLGCREADAAAFVAGASLFCGATSMLLGALCSAAGLI